ncbi:glutaredoxin family protein [Candidatus Pacebacteria bacterium]|nr:glutaredoxin family protein [Candidatus Paceibacterota bacterium]
MNDVTNDSAQSEAANTKDVTIYSTPVCHFCQQAKEFFGDNNIKFTEHDVASDQDKRTEMIEMTGQMGVPVIVIGDDAVVGFDEAKVKELLEL